MAITVSKETLAEYHREIKQSKRIHERQREALRRQYEKDEHRLFRERVARDRASRKALQAKNPRAQLGRYLDDL